MNIGQVQIPDFAGSLARGEQAQASRLQQMAMAEQMADQRGQRALLAEVGPALVGNDPAARASALQRMAMTPGGLSMALPMIQNAVRPMTPEERATFGVRGNFGIDGNGRPVQLEASDELSPGAVAQRIQIANASRAPQPPLILGPGQVAYGRDGRPIASGPARPPESPFEGSQGGAPQIIADLAPLVASGAATPQQQRTYALAVGQWQTSGAQAVERVGPNGEIQRVLIPRPLPDGFPPPVPFSQALPPSQPEPMRIPPGPAPAQPAAASPNEPRVMSSAMPSAPAGFRWNADRTAVEPVPGGPQDPRIQPLTEAQAKANLFGAQMQMGNDVLGGISIPSNAAILAWRNAPESAVNMALPANDQQYFNALRLFAAGVLRKETGAAFNASELLDVQSRFFPMPGDSPQVISQKERARAQAISSIQAEIPGGMRGVNIPGTDLRAEPPTLPPGVSIRRLD